MASAAFKSSLRLPEVKTFASESKRPASRRDAKIAHILRRVDSLFEPLLLQLRSIGVGKHRSHELGMNEQPESALFPVPVRWFEIPMNTGRWGFARPSDVAAGRVGQDAMSQVESVASISDGSDPSDGKKPGRVGRILNVQA